MRLQGIAPFIEAEISSQIVSKEEEKKRKYSIDVILSLTLLVQCIIKRIIYPI
jgi:hypothetical protein